MRDHHGGELLGFLQAYAAGNTDFRRSNFPLIVGWRLLARLEDLGDSAELRPQDARALFSEPCREEVGPEEWGYLKGPALVAAADAFVQRFGGDESDSHSYAALWRRIKPMLDRAVSE